MPKLLSEALITVNFKVSVVDVRLSSLIAVFNPGKSPSLVASAGGADGGGEAAGAEDGTAAAGIAAGVATGGVAAADDFSAADGWFWVQPENAIGSSSAASKDERVFRDISSSIEQEYDYYNEPRVNALLDGVISF
jgi:hypothetical protein